VLNSVAETIPQLPLDVTPPEIAQRIYKITYQIIGNDDPYREAKHKANQSALVLYPNLKQIVTGSNDPLLTACKLAIAGNSIDLATPSSSCDINSIVRSAPTMPLATSDYPEFSRSIEKSSHVLYLGDNAGEIVFDRILIEELHQIGKLEVSFVVRERPIINDVTFDDAISVSLDRVASIVSSGSDAPATILSQCSPQVLRLYHRADIIIAKGQGNYESLSGEQSNIFFFLKAKCPVVAQLLGVNIGDAILKGQL
jgi:hypothetical protein